TKVSAFTHLRQVGPSILPVVEWSARLLVLKPRGARRTCALQVGSRSMSVSRLEEFAVSYESPQAFHLAARVKKRRFQLPAARRSISERPLHPPLAKSTPARR